MRLVVDVGNGARFGHTQQPREDPPQQPDIVGKNVEDFGAHEPERKPARDDFRSQWPVEAGKRLVDANPVARAGGLRLRPIVMTSIAFIMGVLPLVLADGAGSEVRRAMGAAVFSGMIGVTVFGLMLTPVFYALVRRRRAAEAVLPAPQTEISSHA